MISITSCIAAVISNLFNLVSRLLCRFANMSHSARSGASSVGSGKVVDSAAARNRFWSFGEDIRPTRFPSRVARREYCL